MISNFRKLPVRLVLRKLKLPEKAIRVLILIMIFVQTCSCGNGGACFGPVWKTRVYNDDRGYVGVNKGKQIFANSTINYLYKISTFNASTFYLFEESTRKFLCWKKTLDSMIALDYKKITQRNHWHLCRFRDVPSKTKPETHVHLHLADHPEVRMQFDPKGRYLPPKRIVRCIEKKKIGGRIHPRHAKNCRGHNNFIVWPGSDHKDCCRDAYKIFCNRRSHLRFMPELAKSCKDMRTTSKCN